MDFARVESSWLNSAPLLGEGRGLLLTVVTEGVVDHNRDSAATFTERVHLSSPKRRSWNANTCPVGWRLQYSRTTHLNIVALRVGRISVDHLAA